MVFESATGKPVKTVKHDERSAVLKTQSVAAALHFMEFGGGLVRWLYFLCGMAGAAVIASGLVLFEEKRAKRKDHRWLRGSFRLIEVLNIAAVSGIVIASAAFLWAERVLPVDTATRPAMMANVFYLAWLASLAHAGLRPRRNAWIEQLAFAALLCLGVPFLAMLVPTTALPTTILGGDWVRAGMDLTCLGSGLMLGAYAAGSQFVGRADGGGASVREYKRWLPVAPQ